jgi:hypothetical protein
MWVIALLFLLISSLLFVFNHSISKHLNVFFKVNNTTTLIKMLASAFFCFALAINIAYWKIESAFILTFTFFGPFMFFAILNKSKAST